MNHHAYAGSPDSPIPPVAEEGWSSVSADHVCFGHARHYAGSGVLGELPLHHFQDVTTPTGLYRFFHYDSPVGGQIGALHFDGVLVGETTNAGLVGAADPGSTLITLTSDGTGNFQGSDGNGYTLGGSSGSEPIPANTASCTWVPDATNSAVTAMAQAISYGTANKVTTFQNQAVYQTTVAGVLWDLVMWSGDCVGDGGTYNCVSTFRCQPGATPPPHVNPPNPAPSSSSSSAGGIIAAALAALLGIGGVAWASSQHHKKTQHA